MNIDVIVADIGSTFTKVNGFDKLSTNPVYLNKGVATTSIKEGDVTVGLDNAINNLKQNLKTNELTWNEMFITCSAAGGLSMSVHGLVHDMTVKAGREAALGAGAVLIFSTAGKISKFDIENLERKNPKIILLTGGVDFGEKEIIINNAKILASSKIHSPVIFAGNCAIKDQIKQIFNESNKEIIITENVYPNIDELNIQPTRKNIYKTFEKNIIKSPGMEKIQNYTSKPILPTPLAVMKMAELSEEILNDLLVVDMGGATTDIHSVSDGDEFICNKLLHPEPRTKRTVEGDLGLFINKNNLYNILSDLEKKEIEKFNVNIENIGNIPASENEAIIIIKLAIKGIQEAIKRHTGVIHKEFSSQGKITYYEGKDLTKIKNIIGTGGFLSKFDNFKNILPYILTNKTNKYLMPSHDNIEYYKDYNYIMSSLGILSGYYPKQALEIFLVNINRNEF